MQDKELFQEAQLLLVQGKHDESIGAFTKAIEAGFKNPVAFLSRGVARLQTSDFGGAAEDFTRAIGLDAKNARAFYYRGVLSMIKESYVDAVEDLTRAIKLKDDYGVAFFARGTALIQIDREEEGMKDIKSAIAISEAQAQGFVDTFGILRTQFDKILAIAAGENEGPLSLELTNEETLRLKNILQEG